MKPLEICYLSLGSNLGDREKHLDAALHAIRSLSHVDVTGRSPVYETEPVGRENQPWYLNQVIALQTTLGPLELLTACLEIEKNQGRKRPFSGASRTLDIDILFYGNEVINQEGLQVPHSRIHLRRFVLLPLSDLCPEWIHPVLGKTVQRLLRELKAPHKVEVYRPKRRHEIQTGGAC